MNTNAMMSQERKLGEIDLARAAALDGPCVTLLLPDHQPGAAAGTHRAQFRALVEDAKKQIAAIRETEWPRIEQWEPAADLDRGGSGLAFFLNGNGEVSFPLPGAAAQAVAGSYPYLVPLVEAAKAERPLYVLDLNKKHLRLFDYTGGLARPLDLPDEVPANLDEAGHPHARRGIPAQSHVTAGVNAGAMKGVRFGTAGAREAAQSGFEHFCALIDQGLRLLPEERPLLLMGVGEEIAAYRRVAHAMQLLDTEVTGNTEALTPTEIAGLARNAARAEALRAGLAALHAFHEMRDRSRALHDIRAILPAAAGGRVHQLIVRSDAALLGPLPKELDRAHLAQEDLLNASVVETIRHGGEVFVLPGEHMPVTESVCAVLRY